MSFINRIICETYLETRPFLIVVIEALLNRQAASCCCLKHIVAIDMSSINTSFCQTYLETRPVPVVAVEALTDCHVILHEGGMLEPLQPSLLLHPPLKLTRLVDLCKPLVVREWMEGQSAKLCCPGRSNQQESGCELPEIFCMIISDRREREGKKYIQKCKHAGIGEEKTFISATMQKTKSVSNHLVIAAHLSPAFSMIFSSVDPWSWVAIPLIKKFYEKCHKIITK